MTVADAVKLFRTAPFRWWLSGGHALDAHLGRSWRAHDGADITITRFDIPRIAEVLDGWDIHVGVGGVLTPWDGRPLDADPSDRAANHLWCRPSPDEPWALDITVGDGDDHQWIYRPDPSIRRPWHEAVLFTDAGIPYLAPELQLLIKSQTVRAKDDVDAITVISELAPERRSWLAHHLAADHQWQTMIARSRAILAIESKTHQRPNVELLAVGRSSQAWRTADCEPQYVIRVPIPNSGRLISYRSEELIGGLLEDAGHRVSRWSIEPADDVHCSVGHLLDGAPIAYDNLWSESFVDRVAALLRELHHLPATGWGPLQDTSSRLHGTSASAEAGIVDRWFHAPIWPFDGTDLTSHPITTLEPALVPEVAACKRVILAAASAPFGVVHSDLHRQHLLHVDGELSGVLDFGDAFVGSTAWDFALLHWYYGAANAERVAETYQPGGDVAERGFRLAVAVGCYKIAKTPASDEALDRLRSLLVR